MSKPQAIFKLVSIRCDARWSLFAVLGLLATPGNAASFRGLGTLPGAEVPSSRPRDITPDGTIVVGESRSANGMEAFRWTASTGMVGLGNLGGGEPVSSASAVSADGSVVVGGSTSPNSPTQNEAFRWTATTGMVGLGDLPGGDEFSSAASGVSSDGSIVTGSSSSTLAPFWGEAFRWTEPSGMVGLGIFPGSQSPATIPQDLSADGEVIVGWSGTANGREAFRWSQEEGLFAMGDLPGGFFDSQAKGVSADGSVIVGFASNPSPTAFRWSAETGMVDLGRPPSAFDSGAFGVSADGNVVVGDSAFDGDVAPILWTASTGMRNLVDVLTELGVAPQFAGWDLEQAEAVSADGMIITGWGFNPEGFREAWIVDLGEPSVVEVPTASGKILALFAALLGATAFATLRLR